MAPWTAGGSRFFGGRARIRASCALRLALLSRYHARTPARRLQVAECRNNQFSRSGGGRYARRSRNTKVSTDTCGQLFLMTVKVRGRTRLLTRYERECQMVNAGRRGGRF